MTDRADAALWHARIARERKAKLAAMRREQKLRRELKTLKRSMGAYREGYNRGYATGWDTGYSENVESRVASGGLVPSGARAASRAWL